MKKPILKYKITLPLPDLSNIASSNYIFIEQMRQAKFTAVKSILEGCYMKFACKDIITGDTYQSRSEIIAVSEKELNVNEIRIVITSFGFIMTKLNSNDWRDVIPVKET
jgi:hypothetical protein